LAAFESSRVPSAPLAGGLLIGSYGVVAASGSRPLGGAVLLAGGLALGRLWRARQGTRVAAQLVGVGFTGFVASHLIALELGAWPGVLIAAAGTAAATWAIADARALGSRPPAHSV
jgi:hypothetical protein